MLQLRASTPISDDVVEAPLGLRDSAVCLEKRWQVAVACELTLRLTLVRDVVCHKETVPIQISLVKRPCLWTSILLDRRKARPFSATNRHPSMATNALTLFCLVDGESTANAFPVKATSAASVGELKELIKAKKSPEYDGIAADRLTLWRATILVDENAGDENIITLDDLDDKTKLGNPRTCLSKLFPESPDDNTYIIVQPPPPAPKRDREEDVGEYY
ncbi:hypothetical protein BC939DRAFT_150994 [Gamsiella multidivaricata]|uniref:uncharacterized protein n=1 Tax=Gamsiella multidivaricata TaxID=101098 RepID=UPI00221FBD72|nr:uncharacterized protein BC939DRAFT_150994 [Gamsiella multidivaricata]KAI7831832.1 hypothetical protein BC939DRAFT_150994 [Gamsiella multidivaricata]